MSINVKQMIIAYLQEHGFDGLCNSDHECGCTIDDFMPCHLPCFSDVIDCKAAYKRKGKDWYDYTMVPSKKTIKHRKVKNGIKNIKRS